MRVIDIDSHMMEPHDWLERRFPELAAQLPKASARGAAEQNSRDDMLDSAAKAVRKQQSDEQAAEQRAMSGFGDATFARMIGAMYSMNREQALEFAETLEGTEKSVAERIIGSHFAYGRWDPSERTEVLDKLGVDFQFVLHSGFQPYAQAMALGNHALAYAGLSAGNTNAAEQLAGYTDCMSPVTLVDLADLDYALAEIKRMRDLGSRIVQIRTDPVEGKAISHPDFDVLWSTITDHRMVAMAHVGAARALIDPGWMNNGGSMHHTTLLQFSQVHQVGQVALAGLIYGGVFERHPNLHFCMAELGFEWLPSFIYRCDRMVADDDVVAGFLGDYEYSLKPSEFVSRQVHIAALPRNYHALGEVLSKAPVNSMAFSSDYPHVEGYFLEARSLYETQLADFDEKTVESFYAGGSLADYLAMA